MIQENLRRVIGEIEAVCKDGRKGEERLIAVTKTQPVASLLEAYESGIRDFGENKVQEIMDKYEQLPRDVRWHMIGHLQRNKVKYIIDKVYMIHSVDSLRLAEEIDLRAGQKGIVMPILIEVNIALEDSKFGVLPDACEDLIRSISMLKNVRVKGLMTVAPYVEQEEENRRYFKAMKELSVDITRKSIDNVSMSILSMGMTGDYRVALEEGADYVRVGTGIFGQRT